MSWRDLLPGDNHIIVLTYCKLWYIISMTLKWIQHLGSCMAMNKWIRSTIIVTVAIIILPSICSARGTRHVINWPYGHLGPVYVQVYDIRCNPPYELLDQFKVWVTWDGQTACYDIGNRGTYLLKLYKNAYGKGPTMIWGNAASFRIRYSLAPPWIWTGWTSLTNHSSQTRFHTDS